MADVALISELTWRSLEMQKAAFPDMPHYIAPDELSSLFRPTQRKQRLFIHVMSLAVVAKDGDDFESFWRKLPKDWAVRDLDRGEIIEATFPIKKAKMLFLSARKFGIAKIGGKISAAKREDESKASCAKIKDRWPLPNKTWPTQILLKEAGISYNTAVKYLDPRPRVQFNYEAALKRKARRQKAKAA